MTSVLADYYHSIAHLENSLHHPHMASRKNRLRKGGRGIKAPYKSPPIRCPDPIRNDVESLINLYIKSGFSESPPLIEDLIPDADDKEPCKGLFTIFYLIRLVVSANSEEPESPPAPSC